MSIDVEADGAVTLITLNRPEAHNALDPEHDAAANHEGQERPVFSAGADLRTLIPPVRDAVRAGEDPAWNFGGFTTTERTKPMIAAVNGHALAGGLEMALACDIRLASPNATFGLAETKWAIIPGAGGTVRLPRAVPLGIAMEMILSGDPIDAAEAHRIGLVNRLVPLADLRTEAMRLAAVIASRGPLAVRSARASILTGLGLDLRAALAQEHERFIDVMRTEDAKEGPRAFAERRDPQYAGR